MDRARARPQHALPIFGGSTGGLLRKAQVEEFYVSGAAAKLPRRAAVSPLSPHSPRCLSAAGRCATGRAGIGGGSAGASLARSLPRATRSRAGARERRAARARERVARRRASERSALCAQGFARSQLRPAVRRRRGAELVKVVCLRVPCARAAACRAGPRAPARGPPPAPFLCASGAGAEPAPCGECGAGYARTAAQDSFALTTSAPSRPLLPLLLPLPSDARATLAPGDHVGGQKEQIFEMPTAARPSCARAPTCSSWRARSSAWR